MSLAKLILAFQQIPGEINKVFGAINTSPAAEK